MSHESKTMQHLLLYFLKTQVHKDTENSIQIHFFTVIILEIFIQTSEHSENKYVGQSINKSYKKE